MDYIGYVADIDDDVDAYELDFEDTNYLATDAVIVSKDRIRLEWTENDTLCAVTISQIYENEGTTYGYGRIEISYETWEGGRTLKKQDVGAVNAEFIARRVIKRLQGLAVFWIDVRWSTEQHYTGRLIFELERSVR